MVCQIEESDTPPPPKKKIAHCPKSLEKGTGGSPHLLARRQCGPGAAERAASAGVGRPLPRCAPTSGRRIPRILSHGVGSSLLNPGGISDPRLPRAAPFPGRGSSSPLLDFSSRNRSTARKGRPGEKAFRKSTGERLGCGRAGLARRNSGGLCSPQLFPDHLTRQLLGKRCC